MYLVPSKRFGSVTNVYWVYTGNSGQCPRWPYHIFADIYHLFGQISSLKFKPLNLAFRWLLSMWYHIDITNAAIYPQHCRVRLEQNDVISRYESNLLSFKEINNSCPNTRLKIIGYGDMEKELKNLVNINKLEIIILIVFR